MKEGATSIAIPYALATNASITKTSRYIVYPLVEVTPPLADQDRSHRIRFAPHWRVPDPTSLAAAVEQLVGRMQPDDARGPERQCLVRRDEVDESRPARQCGLGLLRRAGLRTDVMGQSAIGGLAQALILSSSAAGQRNHEQGGDGASHGAPSFA